MADFFFQIVTDAVNYDDTERQAELFALGLSDVRDWVKEILEEEVSNEFLRQSILADLCGRESDFPYQLYRYIQDKCAPEEVEDPSRPSQ